MDGPGDHYMNITVLRRQIFHTSLYAESVCVYVYVLHSSILSVYIKRTLWLELRSPGLMCWEAPLSAKQSC